VDLELELSRLSIQPGDTVIVTVKGRPSRAEIEKFTERIRSIVRQNKKFDTCYFIVVNESVTVERLEEFIKRMKSKQTKGER
jgi:hypothetical protein